VYIYMSDKNESWYCYILRNTHPKYCNITYNGSTNDPVRRLRQHNEEIKGEQKRRMERLNRGKYML
jgi:predicted GIY-YIG superfamily endonuclease